MKVTIQTKVVRVYERDIVARAWKEGNETMTERKSLGWHVVLFDPPISFCWGQEKPDLKAGDTIRVTFEKEPKA